MLITLAGVDGAGKSTQSKFLLEWLKSKNIEVTILDKWDIFNLDMFPECRFIQPDLDQLRECISEMDGPARALFLIWSVTMTMKNFREDSSRIYISDGYWIKHLASEILYGNEEQWLLSIISHLPSSDLVLYFEIDAAETTARKKSYTPYECGRQVVSKQTFFTHQTKLKNLLDNWSRSMGWTIINAEQGADDVFKILQAAVMHMIDNYHE